MPDLPSPPGRGADVLPGLARRAVQAVAAVPATDADAVADRLYCYHRIPWGPRWSAALPDPALLLASARGWRRPVPVRQAGGWLSLSRDDARAEGPRKGFGYKVYLSPMPGEVAQVLPLAAAAAARVGVVRFKVGADPIGLLRPDKIVFYLHQADEVSALAEALVAELAGTTAHGVPFTAALTADGLLSWAGDPAGEARESWRLRVCRLLGGALVAGADPEAAIAGLARHNVRVPEFAPADLEPPESVRSAA